MSRKPRTSRFHTSPLRSLSAILVAIALAPGLILAAGFSPTGPMTTARARAAAGTGDGKVLVAGGTGYSGFCLPMATAELYDPSTGLFTPTGGMTATRCEARSVTLNDGRVLVVGGLGSGIGTAELFDASTGLFSPA